MGKVGRRHSLRIKLDGVNLDPHFAIDSADPLEAADPRHTQDCFADRIVDEPGQGLFIHAR